jgi:murein L,D-transpeptidase YcbB/YkuD
MMNRSTLPYLLFPVILISKAFSSYGQQAAVVFDSTRVAGFYQRYPGLASSKDQLLDFYRARKYAYAWFEDGLLTEQSGDLQIRLMNLPADGLYRTIPYQKTLDSLLDAARGQEDKKQPDPALELMLTAQYFIFSKLAWQGMDSAASRSSGWYLPRKTMAYDQYLDSLLAAPAKQPLPAEPVYRQYELLRNFLRKYRALDAGGSWAPILLPAGRLEPGDTAAVVPLIKARLFKLEDFHGDTLTNNYTQELQQALRQFQDRHGLPVNGRVDKATLAELNVPLKSRISQLLVNMERSRWLPVSLNSDYLAVNIPEFSLHVYHADSLLWSCSVVVGQTMHQTTLFYGEIQYVVFSPYWNIPESIVRREIMPGITKDPDYIAKHAMKITGSRDGLPIVRQKPGPMNSLGLVKFLFPNSYDIYLHDTPSKSLFGESSRAFSHGCIRVMEPAKLAGFLLRDSANWDAEKIAAAMHAGKEHSVTLTKKVPVFIAYFTAFTDRQNRLNFRKDIYNLDGRLAAMILSGNALY